MNRKAFTDDLEEYRGNAFIQALPPILSDAEVYQKIQSMPKFQEYERHMEDKLRKHCVLRLGRYFDPLPSHVRLYTTLEAIIRQGYVGRTPADTHFLQQVARSAGHVRQGSFTGGLRVLENTATSFGIIGCSGVGKSVSIEKILSGYKKFEVHSIGRLGRITQLPYVKLDCSHKGSESILCDAFFIYVDSIIGSDYFNRFGGENRRIGLKLLAMAHVASLHAVGVLIIDEIQHLLAARDGPEAMLNFLVTLENTIGIPVVLVGTLAALPLVQGTFRQARRASCFGSMVWDRLPRGEEWTHWASRLWEYQWTENPVPWSEEIDIALHDESQGVKDIAIKLHIMTQWRAITVGKRRGGERLSVELLRRVAREEFQVIRPMMEALRSGNLSALRRYDDLLPLHKRFEFMLAELGLNPLEDMGSGPYRVRDIPVEAPRPTRPPLDVVGDACVDRCLKELGVADDVARIALAAAKKQVRPGDALGLLAAVMRLLSAETKSKRNHKQRSTRSPVGEAPTLPPNDLRCIVASGREKGLSPRLALARAGIVVPPQKVSSPETTTC